MSFFRNQVKEKHFKVAARRLLHIEESFAIQASYLKSVCFVCMWKHVVWLILFTFARHMAWFITLRFDIRISLENAKYFMTQSSQFISFQIGINTCGKNCFRCWHSCRLKKQRMSNSILVNVKAKYAMKICKNTWYYIHDIHKEHIFI